jgi:hypothetical protein
LSEEKKEKANLAHVLRARIKCQIKMEMNKKLSPFTRQHKSHSHMDDSEALTTMGGILVGAVAAVLLLVALPTLRYAAAVVATELIYVANVLCKDKRRVNGQLMALIN